MNDKKLSELKEGDKVKWIHNKYYGYLGKVSPHRLEKILEIKKITENTIETEFGTYYKDTGENIFEPCGCNRFCDCFGKIYPF